jgi:hypothetical protein
MARVWWRTSGPLVLLQVPVVAWGDGKKKEDDPRFCWDCAALELDLEANTHAKKADTWYTPWAVDFARERRVSEKGRRRWARQLAEPLCGEETREVATRSCTARFSMRNLSLEHSVQ